MEINSSRTNQKIRRPLLPPTSRSVNILSGIGCSTGQHQDKPLALFWRFCCFVSIKLCLSFTQGTIPSKSFVSITSISVRSLASRKQAVELQCTVGGFWHFWMPPLWLMRSKWNDRVWTQDEQKSFSERKLNPPITAKRFHKFSFSNVLQFYYCWGPVLTVEFSCFWWLFLSNVDFPHCWTGGARVQTSVWVGGAY